MSRQDLGLPATLPSVSRARLPATYEAAKTALSECARIDECKDWADKAQAMASYAKQAQDESLFEMATKVKARAIRRCGELLKSIDKGRPGPKSVAAPVPNSRASAARDAGLSKRQAVTAVRVANVPEPEFESAVERPGSVTVTELAERGKKSRPLDVLEGRDPADFKAATETVGRFKLFVDLAGRIDPAAVVRGCAPHEKRQLVAQLETIEPWVRQLRKELR